MKIKITTRQASQRLDKFLSNEILKISRNQVQKIIKQNKVLVNNKDTTSHYMLKAGDDI
ncbi:RluA family pseudouridine synthase, partial [Patescibacteria group bacterium]|nr:RluA family pseudouridine synthase [Patescibacteria group bacterium]